MEGKGRGEKENGEEERGKERRGGEKIGQRENLGSDASMMISQGALSWDGPLELSKLE